MRVKRLLSIGVTGTVVTAICCFTPVLVLVLGGIGLASWLGWLDYVLFPLLGTFVAITIIAGWRLWMQRRAP